MIGLSVGCNFDRALIDGIARLNAVYAPERQVTELFGSVASSNPIGTARPTFRLSSAAFSDALAFVRDAARIGIAFNYTLNASFVDPRVLHERSLEIGEFLQALQNAGVARLIVAHPLVAKIIRTYVDLPIGLSTILQVRHSRQLDEFCRRITRIDKLCVDVFANRNPRLLRELAAAAARNGVSLEMLVNEFCIYECPDRNPCYDLHALNLSSEETRLFAHYPMGNCIRQRIRDPREWLRARFLLPEWLPAYADRFGIRTFKVSGRTHPTAYILRVTEAYLSGQYSGNIAELWADVENIGKAEDEYRAPRVVLDAAALGPEFLAAYLDRDESISPDEEDETINAAYLRCARNRP